MSLNEGTNFTLTSNVFYKFYPEQVDVKVEAILKRALAELEAIDGSCATLEIGCAHEDCERNNRYLDYLSQFMTHEQIDELHKI